MPPQGWVKLLEFGSTLPRLSGAGKPLDAASPVVLVGGVLVVVLVVVLPAERLRDRRC